MNWTTEKPSKPGWYWEFYHWNKVPGFGKEIVRIHNFDINYHGYIKKGLHVKGNGVWSEWKPIEEYGNNSKDSRYKWWGPIPEPEEGV